MTLFNSRLTVAALILANAALLGAVALTSSPKAQAALGEGHISMVVGQSLGAVPETVYLVDVDSGKAAAVLFNVSTKKFESAGVRDISKDLNDKGGRPTER